MQRPAHPPDLEVELRRFFTDDEALSRPLPQGWRTPNDFGLPGELNDGMYIFKGNPPGPGETALAELWLLAPERNSGRLYEGYKFVPWPLGKIGEAIIRTVVNPILRSDVDAADKEEKDGGTT
jgi:hypothetical protein